METQFRYSYGQAVQIISAAPSHFHPSAYGSIVGMRRIETREHSISCGYEVGTILYTVEYIDGSDQEIPEEFLVVDMGEST